MQVPETPDALVVFNIPTDNYKQIIGVYDESDWEQNKLVCDYITVDGNKIKVTSSLKGNPIYTFSAGKHTIEYYFYTAADNIHHKIFSSGFLDATSTSNTSLNNVVSVTFSDQVILAPQLWDIDYSFNTFFKGTKTLWQEKLNSLPSWLTMASYKTHFKNGVVHCTDGDYIFE